MVALRNPTMDIIRTLGDLDHFLSEARPTDGWNAPIRPAIDLFDTGDQLVLKALMPGVTPENMEVSVERNTLHLSGTFGYELSDDAADRVTWYRREIGSGRFSEEVALPAPIDSDNVDATFEDGILTLIMPKAEQARAKQIEVKTPHALTG